MVILDLIPCQLIFHCSCGELYITHLISYRAIFLYLILLSFSVHVYAGEANVVKVKVNKHNNTYTFKVTVRHNDIGWIHYANRWEVLSPDGKILATRVLMHPHEHEQPFTRSMSGIKIPADLEYVMVRAHDLKHGYGGKEVKVLLSKK